MKTRYCADCEHADMRGDLKNPLVCTKGHKPRFYMPRGDPFYPYPDRTWGWKRKCADFQEGTPLGINKVTFKIP